MNFASRSVRIACAALLLVLVGCASPPKPPPPPPPTIIQVSLDAQANVNPDTRGRPSPVVVRFYELKTPANFNAADFFCLFERDKETLAADMLTRDEFQLMP